MWLHQSSVKKFCKMMRRDFCQAVTWTLLVTALAVHTTSVSSQRYDSRRGRPSGTPVTVYSVNSSQIQQLCSYVLPQQTNWRCSGEPCTSVVPAAREKRNTKATNSSDLELTSAGETDLANVITRMDEGIRVMDSRNAGGNNTFVLGMTGAGKSTVTLLLTALFSLYSCKRSSAERRYLIRDVREIISILDSMSKTKVPEIIYDPHLHTTFYDCPGFSDTNSTDELTNAYFIKHALDGSKQAKFLLVAPYHMLQAGGDRTYFSSLLLHTVKTVKNMGKYKSSFALAVTFASPHDSQKENINDVAAFMENFLNEELDRKFEGQEAGVLNSARALLESLLAQDENDKYVAIGIFRSLTSHGPLSDIQSAKEDRQLLLRVLTNDTFYKETDPLDFGYSVSDGGKLRTAELVSMIDEKITQKMDRFWADIQRHYEEELYHLSDPIDQKNKIEATLRTFLRVRQLLNAPHTSGKSTGMVGLKQLIFQLMSSMASLRLDLPSNPNLSSILLQESHLRFAETLAGKSHNLQWTNWLRRLEPIVTFLQLYTNWAHTLMQLEQNLGKYEIQNADYSLPEFRDPSSGQINVTAAKIQKFISTRSAPTDVYNTLKSALAPFVASDDTRVNFYQLNPVLEYFFSRSGPSSFECTSDGTTAKFRGNFILASKLKTASCISSSTKHVVIQAWDTFFLDATINAESITGNGPFSLVIIASKLKSLNQKIVLSGRDGHTSYKRTAALGQDGAHGTDGEDGSNFFFLFGESEGTYDVESHGGNGGDGQHGGEGVKGEDGIFVREYDLVNKVKLDHTWHSTHFHGYADACDVKIPKTLPYSYSVSYPGKCAANINWTQSTYDVTFYGKSGRPGQVGRDGGRAGQGGGPGVGKIYEINSNNSRSTSASKVESHCGAPGSPGQGGIGGKGGEWGKMTACFVIESITVYLLKRYDCKSLSNFTSVAFSADEGGTGRTGSFPHPPCQQVPDFDPHSYTAEIINYKSTARAQLRSATGQRRCLEFLMNLEQSKDVSNEFFTVKSLTNDLVALEEQLPSYLNAKTSPLLPSVYKSFLNRTAEMLATNSSAEEERSILRDAALNRTAEMLATNSSAEEERSILRDAALNRTAEMLATNSSAEEERSILRDAASLAYGRLAVLKENAMSGRSDLVITDLEDYIDLTNPILQSLKALNSNPNGTNHITATSEDSLNFIRSRVMNVDDLIKHVIEPEISKIQHELNKATDILLRRLIEERNKSVEIRNDLYYSQQQQQLADTLLLTEVFSYLKLGAQAASYAGPLGAANSAVSSVVAHTFPSGSSIGTTLASLGIELQEKALFWQYGAQKQKLENEQLQLADLKANFEETGVAQIVLVDNGTGMWPKDLQANVRTITSALKMIHNITDRVKQSSDLSPPGANRVIASLVQEIKSLKIQIRNGLEAVEKSLRTEAEAHGPNEMGGQNVVLVATRKSLAIFNMDVELYKLVRDDDNKVRELAEVQDVLERPDADENERVNSRILQIYNQLRQITTSALRSAVKWSAPGTSLDIPSWQLQPTLDEISCEIDTKILAGVPIDSEVKTGVATLKEAFRVLFKVCDRIQEYVTEQCMATFVSDSLLSTVQAVPPQRDQEFDRNFQKVKLASQSNLVLNYWRNIENSFRMHVFPYADIYLPQISLQQGELNPFSIPRNLTYLPTLVTEISRRTDELKTKLAIFRTTFTVPEVHTNERAGEFNVTHPFYTWTTEEVKPILADLLSGRAVNLIADIRKSPASFDAIKFNAIHLHLIHENDTVNSTLQSALASFGLNMTHSGVNHYRFDERHYRLYSEPLSFQVAYQLGPNQYKNQSYVKLGQAPPLLSPFTLWTFQLYRNSDSVTFDSLEQLVRQEMSLVLAGYGTFVINSSGQAAERQVDRFYKAIQL